MKLKDKKIGVLMGGLSPEREISLSSGNAVLQALKRKELNAVGIDVGNNIASSLVKNKIEVAFIALHGVFGEDGAIQGLLEYAKPSNQGSSIGVSIVREQKEWKEALKLAFNYAEEILVEKFIEGKLLAIGMNGKNPMTIIHIQPKIGFYDYEAKYTPGKTEYICPAKLTQKETQNCKAIAMKVFQVLRGNGMPRVDVILDTKGTPYVLEMNTIPGMTPTSLLPMAAKKSGLNFDDLVVEILKSAQLESEG